MRSYRQPPDTNRPGIVSWVFMFILSGLILSMCAEPAQAWIDQPFEQYRSTAVSTNRVDTPAEWSIVIGRHFPLELHNMAMSIVSCESNFDPTADNPTSTARGGWQFLLGTWEWVQADSGLELDDYPAGPDDPEQATAAARWLQQTAGWSQWSCYGHGVRDWPVTVDLLAPEQETR